MKEALIVHVIVPELRQQFIDAVDAIYRDGGYKTTYIWDLDTLRKKIVCLCKKGCLHNATIFHYGTSDEALKVSSTRRFDKGILEPAMMSTATSNTLEIDHIQWMNSLSFPGDKINNFRNMQFLESNKNNTYYSCPGGCFPAFDAVYKQDLLGAYALRNSDDIILTKDQPSPRDVESFTPGFKILPGLNYNQNIHSDTAVSQFYAEYLPHPGVAFEAEKISDSIIKVSVMGAVPSVSSINTTPEFLEAAGALTYFNGIKPEVSQNQDEIWKNLTRQLLKP